MHQRLTALQRDEPDPAPVEDRQRPGEGVGIKISGRTHERPVVAFAVFPVADALFREAAVPHRLIPPAIALGAFTFTMTALPGTPAIQNAIPMAYFGTTLFAAPILGILASAVIVGFGLWWLRLIETRARRAGEGYSAETPATADDQFVRERAANADNFDPAELPQAVAAKSCRPLRCPWRRS